MTNFKNILVAVDFGESSDEALELGVGLARKFDAELTLVHSFELAEYAYPNAVFLALDLITPIEQAADAQLQATLEKVRARVPGARAVLRRGAAADQILAAIDEIHPDLVITGTHGRRGIGRALVGSVAERVVRLSPVPVLTVRRSAPGADRRPQEQARG